MMRGEIWVLAHNIRSLHNVGAIFRTAEVFGINKIFLTGYTGTPPDGKIAKTALGAENLVAWEKVKSPVRLIKRLKKVFPNLSIVGLENHLKGGRKPVLLNDFKPTFPVLIVLGEEVSGIGKNLLPLCDVFVEIPQFGKKESLNLSVAFGIACYGLVVA